MARDQQTREQRTNGIRDRISRRMLSVAFIRRWYARRMIKFIDKSKTKHRQMPQHLIQVDNLLRRVPKPLRQKTLEEMLVPGNEEQYGRQLRRAAERQQRASGRGTGRRPGLPPQAQAARRQVRGR